MSVQVPGRVRRPLLSAEWARASSIRLLAGAGTLIFAALWIRDWSNVVAKLGEPNIIVGVDYTFYMDATRRFLAGGPFYESWQLTQTYSADSWPVLYPPQAIVLFAPFTVLPAIAWWSIPIVIVTAAVLWHRPAPLVWPVLALCLWWPTTTIKLLTGNPVLWVAAAVALGTIWRWPAALALLKPSLLPFALIGVRDRRWWLVAGAAAVPFAWMLPDYLRALLNFRGGLTYSIQEVPVLLVPVVAWFGSSRTQPPAIPAVAGLRKKLAQVMDVGERRPGRDERAPQHHDDHQTDSRAPTRIAEPVGSEEASGERHERHSAAAHSTP